MPVPPQTFGGTWVVAAGCWPIRPPDAPPGSSTRRPVIAIGATFDAIDGGNPTAPPMSLAWADVLRSTGGDLQRLLELDDWPPLLSVHLDADLADELRRSLDEGETLAEAVRRIARERNVRLIRWPSIDVCYDPRLRVAQAITSLQRGGAERVVVDLAATLRAAGVATTVIVTGRPTRAAFDPPAGTVDVSRAADRATALAGAAADAHVDLVHAHLLGGDALTAIRAAGLPLVVTVHNTRPGWPAGLAALPAGAVDLLAACSQQVERDLLDAGVPAAVRTVWNGIDFAAYKPGDAADARAAELRRACGAAANDVVLLSLANPRPQKRLERLPAVLAAVRRKLVERGVSRDARLVVAGDTGDAATSGPAAVAAASTDLLRAEVDRLGLGNSVHLIGPADDVPALLRSADVLVSVSAWEGLSLAHLEALAAGRPVVATDVGGAAEVASANPAVTLLPPDADADAAAEAVLRAVLEPPAGGREAARSHFRREVMAERYARLYTRAIESCAAHGPLSRYAGSGRKPSGVWLVANNFSTG
ncbi:MAG TPA: glycosyltransferase, partial [Humisphaera sp.]